MTNEYLVITVPGIGEQASEQPWGMLKNLTDKLPAPKYTAVQFNWQNSYGPVPVWDSQSYDRNIAAATAALVAYLATAATAGHRIVLAGYSGGAQVASMALTQLRDIGNTFVMDHLAAIVMVANPLRRHTDSAISQDVRYGLAGLRGDFPPGVRLFDLANPRDCICATPPPPHPLRSFKDLSEHFSLVDPVDWGVETAQAVSTGTWQNGYKFSSLPAWWDAAALMRGYLWDGQHTTWYLPHFAALANQLDAYLYRP